MDPSRHLVNWQERMPWLLARSVRWLNVSTNNFLARGVRQYTDLQKRHTA